MNTILKYIKETPTYLTMVVGLVMYALGWPVGLVVRPFIFGFVDGYSYLQQKQNKELEKWYNDVVEDELNNLQKELIRKEKEANNA